MQLAYWSQNCLMSGTSIRLNSLKLYSVLCNTKTTKSILTIWMHCFTQQKVEKRQFGAGMALECCHQGPRFPNLNAQVISLRLGLPCYWMVCLGNKQRSFCCFWDSIQVLHFGLFCWPWRLLHSSEGFLPAVVDIMVIWVKFTHSSPF